MTGISDVGSFKNYQGLKRCSFSTRASFPKFSRYHFRLFTKSNNLKKFSKLFFYNTRYVMPFFHNRPFTNKSRQFSYCALWHVKQDKWQMKCDRWHVTLMWWWKLAQNVRPPALTVWKQWWHVTCDMWQVECDTWP